MWFFFLHTCVSQTHTHKGWQGRRATDTPLWETNTFPESYLVTCDNNFTKIHTVWPRNCSFRDIPWKQLESEAMFMFTNVRLSYHVTQWKSRNCPGTKELENRKTTSRPFKMQKLSWRTSQLIKSKTQGSVHAMPWVFLKPKQNLIHAEREKRRKCDSYSRLMGWRRIPCLWAFQTLT